VAKNIVVCCDGTGNEYGDCNSNVMKLFRMVIRDDTQQAGYYNPGLGTLSTVPALTKVKRGIDKTLGLAFGKGIAHNIEDAYRYLMDHYEDGDRIYLFGFSRGAYTVRALAAMLHVCGLLEKGSLNMIPYASKLFKQNTAAEIREGFRETFSRSCPIHFLGVWDTVSSVGWIYDQLKLPFTANNPDVAVLRHAVSIDERRCFFRQNLLGNGFPHQDIQEIWFAGVHSDVGGGYPERESGLAKIALQWMLSEAMEHGLLVDAAAAAQMLPQTGNDRFSAPDPAGPIHESLTGPWWIAEYTPKKHYSHRKGANEFKIPAGERRQIPEGARIHPSVFARRDALSDYNPPNLPVDHVVAG
jgi:uncharacterized protein (DUF2235 family)